MNLKDSICSPDFYKDTGFDVIRCWLKDNCLCSINQIFFTRLSPFYKYQDITDSQLHSDEFLASFQRKDPLPLDIIPDISTWLPSLAISGFQLSPENFQHLYQVLLISSKVKQFLSKTSFPIWNIHGRNLIRSKSAQSEIKKVFDDIFQIKDDASP